MSREVVEIGGELGGPARGREIGAGLPGQATRGLSKGIGAGPGAERGGWAAPGAERPGAQQAREPRGGCRQARTMPSWRFRGKFNYKKES